MVMVAMAQAMKEKSVETLVLNLRALMRATKTTKKVLATRSGVSERMIGYILSGEKVPTVEVTEALAKPFGLYSWQLLLPNLPLDLAKSGKLNKLIDNYSHSSDSGRDYIDRVAEQEAKYQTRK